MKQQLEVTSWRGMTPLALLALVGMGGFAIVRTALMVGCHVVQPYAVCEGERKDWQVQMGLVGGGFMLLFVKSPGTSEAPVATAEPLQSRRAEDEVEYEIIPSAVVIDPDAPEPADERAKMSRLESDLRDSFREAVSEGIVEPLAGPGPDHELSAAERMARAAARLPRGAKQ